MAGLNRLGLGHLPRGFIDPIESPPAPGQGALAIQTREADAEAPWLDGLKHWPTAMGRGGRAGRPQRPGRLLPDRHRRFRPA